MMCRIPESSESPACPWIAALTSGGTDRSGLQLDPVRANLGTVSLESSPKSPKPLKPLKPLGGTLRGVLPLGASLFSTSHAKELRNARQF